MIRSVSCVLLLAAALAQQAVSPGMERLPDGIRLTTAAGILSLHVKTDSIVRVTFAKTAAFRADDMVVVGPANEPSPKWSTASTPQAVTLTTPRLRVTVSRADGAVTFADASGRMILAEAPGGHRIMPSPVQSEPQTYVQQVWKANDDESLYGLGQRQEGKLNIKGYDFDLWQRNTVVEVPVFVSSRGYGILWDNTSPSKWGDTAPFEKIPATQDSVTAPVTGDYQFRTYSNGWLKLWLDGVLQIDAYRQNWATEYDQFKVRLEAGRRYPLKVTQTEGTTLQLWWKTPTPPATSMWSEVGDGIDYYFIYGPEIDRVIAGYRTLTGRATMLPDWAFGFWQSKNKYNTQDEVLKTVAEFRRDDQGDPRPARAFHDLGLGQVLSDDRQLQRDGRAPRALSDDRRGQDEGLAQSRVCLLRHVQRAGAHAVLGPGEPRAVPPRRGRLVDGRDRAGSRAAVAADARPHEAVHAADRDRRRGARDERVSVDEQQGGV
jgi:alpha-D-xyloside xylohydrolase